MQYKCSECGLAVIVLPNEAPIKACKCEGSIIAEMQADAIIHGGLKI